MEEMLQTIIQGCVRNDRQAQKALYNRFASTMYIVCQRYARSREDAEEILQEGFIKVYQHIQQYQCTGSFEGWIRKIMVNCALRRYRNKTKLQLIVNIEEVMIEPVFQEGGSSMEVKDLIKLVQQLPPSYRLVFNLYVFEKMKHREIAAQLGISQGTSKSNLSDAKAMLRKAIERSNQIALPKMIEL